MKIQELAIIFIIIILPISIVLSTYTQYQIQTINTQTLYDTKLTSATFDAIKAFQLNTANSTLDDIANSKIRDIEASVNTFKNSMLTTFRLNGYSQEELDNYIPALVYTMYDGLYIYAPYENTNYLYEYEKDASGNVIKDASGEPIYKTDASGNRIPLGDNEETMYGLKPYISYSCRYQKGLTDIVITYTLDNYITIQGKCGTEYVNEGGYLIDDIINTGSNVTYNGVQIDEEDLKEYVLNEDGTMDEYQYVKYNGTKYYFDIPNERIFYYSNGNFTEYARNDDANRAFLNLLNGFDISTAPTEPIQTTDWGGVTPNEVEFPYKDDGGRRYYYDEVAHSFFWYENGNRFEYRENKSYNDMQAAITSNDAAKRYYREAEEFTYKVKNRWGLTNLTFNDAVEYIAEVDDDGNIVNISEERPWAGDNRKIFESSTNIENKLSNFNQHRLEVIRHKIESKLSIAIANYNNYSGIPDVDFQMPELTEEEWDLVLNNISLISFVQGLDIGGKIYNGYTIVNNTESKEVVQEDRIYILGTDYYYHKIGDRYLTVNESNIVTSMPAGRLNLDFKRKTTNIEESGNKTVKYYYSVKYDGRNSYKASYDSIVTQNNVETFEDIYEYIEGTNYNLKKAFYTALGREREGTYKSLTTNIQ